MVLFTVLFPRWVATGTQICLHATGSNSGELHGSVYAFGFNFDAVSVLFLLCGRDGVVYRLFPCVCGSCLFAFGCYVSSFYDSAVVTNRQITCKRFIQSGCRVPHLLGLFCESSNALVHAVNLMLTLWLGCTGRGLYISYVMV